MKAALAEPAVSKRRKPQQRRALATVEAVLDAVIRILKRDGIAGVTTNRIAEVAGISIGSLYQYFPDKRAIFLALHDRHVREIVALVERTLIAHADAPLEGFVAALVGELIEAHGVDPELQELLANEVPLGKGGARAFQTTLRRAFHLAISARGAQRYTPAELDRILFVLPVIVDALTHSIAHARPPKLSLAAAKAEAVRVVLAYLRA